MASKKNRMTIHRCENVTILDLGAMDIWDGADMALLRETLTELIEQEGCRSIGVDMQHVKYIPSGFFGMMLDCFDRGVAIRLYSPQPHVHKMLWFRQFFDYEADGTYRLRGEPKFSMATDSSESDNSSDWPDHENSETWSSAY